MAEDGGVAGDGGVDPEAYVPMAGGTFWMGMQVNDPNGPNYAPEDIGESYILDETVHLVSLSPFEIGKYEVTVAQFSRCVSAGFCKDDNYWTSSDDVRCNYGYLDLLSHPMNCIKWEGARQYCQWKGGDLPTESQWEFAARGNSGRRYPWGNSPSPDCSFVVMNCGGEDDSTTMPIGSLPQSATPDGVMDMAGNVWEWVRDWYGPYPLTFQMDPSGPQTGNNHIYRGGSFVDFGDFLFRTSYRGSCFVPTTAAGTFKYGFRCSR